MNDDNIILEPDVDESAQNKDSSANANDTPPAKTGDAEDVSAKSEQFIDITPDLNISPVNPDAVVEPVPETARISITVPRKAGIPAENISPIKVYSVTATPDSIKDTYKAPTPESAQQTDSTPPPTPVSKQVPVVDQPLQKTSSYSYIPQAEKTVPGMSSIRTYESDVAEVMTKKGTTTTEMVIAENEKETGEEDMIVHKEPTNSGKKSLFAVLSLILIAAGVIGAYYLYSISPLAQKTTPVAPQTAASVSLIPSDSQKILSADGLSMNNVLTRIQSLISSPGTAGTITEIIPYTTNTDGVKLHITAPEMIKLVDIPAPDILTRSLTSSWMLGVFTDKNSRQSAFIVVTNNFFQNAFAGMLQWESVMPDDLKRFILPSSLMGLANTPTNTSVRSTTSTTSSQIDPLFNLGSILPTSGTAGGATSTIASSTRISSSTSATNKVATSSKLLTTSSKSKTATTTSKTIATSTSAGTSTIEVETPVNPYPTLRGRFVDKIIKNKDVREFVTVNGDTLFLYSFIDNTKLVIAGNESTLTEIITRLEKQAFVR